MIVPQGKSNEKPSGFADDLAIHRWIIMSSGGTPWNPQMMVVCWGLYFHVPGVYN